MARWRACCRIGFRSRRRRVRHRQDDGDVQRCTEARVWRAPVKVPSVLLVAGAYYPEISAAGLQCQAVAAVLKGRTRISVLVTAVDPSLPASETIDAVVVTRVGV